MRSKKLRDQVLVITDATSGIGVRTAEMAVESGARVVLAAQNEPELALLAERLNRARASVTRLRGRRGWGGARAVYLAADVCDPSAAERIAERAVEAFGGFDTWVNHPPFTATTTATGGDERSGGRDEGMADAPLAHLRRVFEMTFWSTVNGCRVAIDYLRRPGGGIINVISDASDASDISGNGRGVAGQVSRAHRGMAQSSAHAVSGFTDALRRETEADGLPVSIALVTAGSSETFEDVARAVVLCAERRPRGITRFAGRESRVGRAAPLVAIGALLAAGVAVSRRAERA